MQWQAVLLPGDDDAALAIATEAQQLLPLLKNPIDVSLISLRPERLSLQWIELQLVLFLNRTPDDAGPFAAIVGGFDDTIYRTGQGAQARNALLGNPHVALAALASRFCSDVLFVHCSDGSCSSGYLKFSHGRLDNGVVYGWNGSDELWRLRPDSISVEIIDLETSGFNYYQPVAEVLTTAIGAGSDELFLSGNPVGGRCLRYQLMQKRQMVSPVTGVPEAN